MGATYHVTGAANWINDPLGLTWQDGTYHVFYQANAVAPVWGPPRWGHATSPDLRHWQRRGLALTPTAGGPDRDGCRSGCLTFVAGEPRIYYTGVIGFDDQRIESICVARGSTDLTTWTPEPEPLVRHAPPELTHGYHRDPFVWRDGTGWHLLVGTAVPSAELRGAIGIYHSTNAHDWEWDGFLVEHRDLSTAIGLGKHWECPQPVQLDGTWVLIFSAQDSRAPQPLVHSVALTGDLDGTYRFHPTTATRLDDGDSLYAATPGRDADGLVTTVGWVQERLPSGPARQLPKAGAFSLPRRLQFSGDRVLPVLHPAWTALEQDDFGACSQPDGTTPAFIAALPVTPGRRQSLQIVEEASSDRIEIHLDPATRRVLVDVYDVYGDHHFSTSATEPTEQSHHLMVYCDGSLAEIFAPGSRPISTRWYRRRPVGRVTTASVDEPNLTVSVVKPMISDDP